MLRDLLQQNSTEGELLNGHVVRSSSSATPAQIADLTSHVVALALAAISLLVYSVLVADGQYGTGFYLWLLVQFALMIVGTIVVRHKVVSTESVPVVSLLMVLLAVLTLIWEWLSRTFFGQGQPFEIMTMTVVKNLVIGLGIFSVFAPQQRLTVVLSLFLTLFGVTASHNMLTQWLAGIFAIGAAGWLIVSHWENLRCRLKGKQRAQYPKLLLAIPVFLLLLDVCVRSTDRQIVKALTGFMPSSGGSRNSDPYARDGVGDGEMLVAGAEQIQSFAPIDDAPFMQDDQPSLYDLFDDSYEEEVRISRTDRAIGLPPELASRAKEHLHARTEKANRKFSTLREQTDSTRNSRIADIKSNALFYVAGRVPLHLRLAVYDLFDGVNWYPEAPPEWKPSAEMYSLQGKPWLRLSDRGIARDFLGPAETHALKIVSVDTSVIPSPLYLHGVHIDLVDRADMYTQGSAGLVAMNRKSLPNLVPIHLASRTIDWNQLSQNSKLFVESHSEQATTVIPENVNFRALSELANQWCVNLDSGWDEVHTIVNCLQREYCLDPLWRMEDSGDSGIEQFLFDSKRGPDYQFATAAALLLRTRGYATRVVSGFYVDPKRYDSDSRHTPVLANDVHFWTEVRISGGDWITVEPTPGYQVLGPPPGFFQRAWGLVTGFAHIVAANWLTVSAIAFSMILIRWKQRSIWAAIHLLQWKFSIVRDPAKAVSSTLILLKRRATIAGHPLEKATTYHLWLSELMASTNDSEQAKLIYEFRKEIDVAAYSTKNSIVSASLTKLCRDVVSTLTLTWFTDHFSSHKSSLVSIENGHKTRIKTSHGKSVESVGN